MESPKQSLESQLESVIEEAEQVKAINLEKDHDDALEEIFEELAEAAESAEAEFDRIHRDRQMPTDIPTFFVDNSELTDGQIWVGRLLTLAGLSKSSSEARRLVIQGGVRLDGEKVVDPAQLISIEKNQIVQVGKRRFVQIRLR